MLNVKIQTYRGTRTNLAALASTGFPGVLAWTTDTNELFVDSGSGTGIGSAWLPVHNEHTVFNVANPAALTALTANMGDFAISASDGKTYILSSPGSWVAITQPDVTPLGAPVAHEWVMYVDAAGIQHLSQPAFTDISGLLAQAQLPTTIGAGSSLTNLDCGSF